MKILALNAGSSSLKAALYSIEGPSAAAALWETNAGPGDAAALLGKLHERESIDAVGHRIVHGGSFQQSVVLTADVRAAIAKATDLAPTHNRAGLEGIAAVDRVLGDRVPQVAVFDTAFHATMPMEAAVYPGPYAWFEQGVRRYGFHGISHRYAAARAAQMLGRAEQGLRVITCHLGNGCSLAAVRSGQSVDTTMGFTPLEGLMMGTRSGSIDPGLLIHLMREQGYSAEDLDRVLNRESGLLGISGISADMREIEAAMDRGDRRAALAHAMFAYRVRWHIGAMAASLGGVDVIVFTGGIGENSVRTRSAVCAGLGFLGVGPTGATPVVVVRAREEWAIAQECYRVLQSHR